MRLEPLMRLLGRIVLAAALSLVVPAMAQTQVEIQPRPKRGAEPPARPNLRVNTMLILVPVSVNDPLNRPVAGLEKENFRVFEDKVQQTITQFSMEDEATAVGLVFDTSGSMGDKLQRSRMAAREFFRIDNQDVVLFLLEF
jgi:Ca-activated chloride channel family protein